MTGRRIGIDIGGTFTDFIGVDPDAGDVVVVKTPSTPDAPERAVGDALGESKIESAAQLSHGTTVVTNAILERTGAETALVTTRGFGDVLEIGRQDRGNIYDLRFSRPDPLVSRHHRFEVTERIGPDGEVVAPLAEEEVREAAAIIAASDVESVAVSFLHSYVDDAHERRTAEILREELDLPVTRSSAVLPEFREYERTNTTALNAYTRPVAEAYLENLLTEIDRYCAVDRLHVMRSDGGVIPPAEAAVTPVQLGVSGPAAGVVAATTFAGDAGHDDIIGFDMGGTSADVSLVRDGTPEVTTEGSVGDQSVSVPMFDIRTIGAGGGSIAWIDEGGLLKVGPQSAGADPGPACYGHGGTEPTVTDANLLLGLFDAGVELGGEITLSRERAAEAMEPIADALDTSIEEAAHAVVEVVTMRMVETARVLSVRQGIDPREFALVAFGGAGPLHAAAIARELGVERLLVPPRAGILSAVGLLYSDVRRTASRTSIAEVDVVDPEAVEDTFRDLEDDLTDEEASGVRSRQFDVRFAGQAYELPVDAPTPVTPEGLDLVAEQFRERHRERYGFVTDSAVELVTYRVAAVEEIDPIEIDWGEPGGGDPREREVFLDGEHRTATVLDWTALEPGDIYEGPAIVEMAESTVLALPGQVLSMDDGYNLAIEEGSR